MSLRDIYGNNDDKPIILNTEPMGNASGLGSFHTVSPEEREPNNTPKIVGGLVVALMIGAAGAYIYSVSGHQPKQVVANNTLPAPSEPAPAAAPAPMPAPASTPAPEATPAPAPASDISVHPVTHPVRQAALSRPSKSESSSTPDMGAAQARMQADSTPAVQPQQQSVVTPSEPVSPQAPSSSVAAISPAPQQTPTDVAPQPAPAPQAAAPAPDQQAATPAPAAPPAQ